MSLLSPFPSEQNLTASCFTATSAFERAVLGYFDRRRKDYRRIPVEQQFEVLGLIVRRHAPLAAAQTDAPVGAALCAQSHAEQSRRV